ncbi:MAG: tripartite tricarboxylate transporter substrate binding protein [Treponemataceae bacterium]
MIRRIAMILLAATVTVSLTSAEGQKDKFPRGDVTFVNPNAAGGGNDLIMRALIPGMKSSLGVNVIPENKPASRGAIAALDITKAKPDGQKVYINSQTLILMPYGGVEVDVEKFQPVAQVVEDTGVVLVKADAPYNTLQEFVAKAKTAKLKVSHNGAGSLWHLAAVMFAKAAGVEFQYVAYSGGGAPMLTALASGEIDMVIVNPAESKALMDAGKIKPLAVMSDGKHPMLTSVPTCVESGVKVTFPVWRGIFTTKGTPEASLAILEKSVKAGMGSPEFKNLVTSSGLEEKFKGYAEFSKFFEEQKVLTAQLMKEINGK